MSRPFSFYHRESGVIHPTRFSTDDPTQLKNNVPVDHLVLDGHFDHLSQRVNLETGMVEDFIPPPPSKDHVWNPETRRHQLTTAAAERQALRLQALHRVHALEFLSLRPLRELALGIDGANARLAAIDQEITELREKYLTVTA